MRLHDQFSADVSDRRGVGTRITPFYAQKVDFGADRHDGFLLLSQNHVLFS